MTKKVEISKKYAFYPLKVQNFFLIDTLLNKQKHECCKSNTATFLIKVLRSYLKLFY